MKQTILFGGLVLWVLTAGAEARSWGFDKDTVYEWKPGGDTVRLVNNGADTLRLDSLFAEGVQQKDWYNASFLYNNGQNGVSVDQVSPRIKIIVGGIPAGEAVQFYRFSVANIIAKRSATYSSYGDTLRVRLRFKSTGFDEDTLIVVGFCCGTSIKLPYGGDLHSFHAEFMGRDILGRIFVPSWNFPVLKKPSK